MEIKVTPANVHSLPTETLSELWNLIETELDRREWDESDPASPQNTREDARVNSLEDLDPMLGNPWR